MKYNKDKLLNAFQDYRNILQSPDYDEIYKWQAIKIFQEKWDLNAADLYNMIDESLDPVGKNLWVSGKYMSKPMLLLFAQKDPHKVKGMFFQLFDETKPLQSRVNIFRKQSKELTRALNDPKAINSYQDERAVLLYLSFRYPEEYYLYKYKMFKDFCELIECDYVPRTGNENNVSSFLKLAELVKRELKEYPKIIQLQKSKLTQDCYQDPNLNLLIQDVMFTVTNPDQAKQGLEGKTLMKESNTMKELSHHPLNVILYGSPGTGKTYQSISRALDIVHQNSDYSKSKSRESLVKEFNELQTQGQIEFITFHQSYSYEDFVEGIRPTIDAGDVNYVFRKGVFKRIAERAAGKRGLAVKGYDFDMSRVNFFKLSLGNTLDSDDDQIYDYCIKNNFISLGWGGDKDYSSVSDSQDWNKAENEISEIYYQTNKDKSSYGVQAIYYFKNLLKKDDIVFISEGNRYIRAIAKVVGDYLYGSTPESTHHHFRTVEWLIKDRQIPISDLYEKSLSQQSIYQFYKDKIKVDNVRKMLSVAELPKDQKYVLIIDEINRGNISIIFGELITLIEEDKRLGAENELKVRLPYTDEEFGVPGISISLAQ